MKGLDLVLGRGGCPTREDVQQGRMSNKRGCPTGEDVQQEGMSNRGGCPTKGMSVMIQPRYLYRDCLTGLGWRSTVVNISISKRYSSR
jgi:hypothetical protein